MLQPFFLRLEALQFATWFDANGYVVSFINVAHLIFLTVFVGAVLTVDLRLLGSGMRKQPLAQVARDAQPWMIGAFVGLAVTGVLQILATPLKAYFSPQFWLKVDLLAVAIIFTLTIRRMITRADEKRIGPVWGKLVGLASIGLWVTIAICGRLIGLLQ